MVGDIAQIEFQVLAVDSRLKGHGGGWNDIKRPNLADRVDNDSAGTARLENNCIIAIKPGPTVGLIRNCSDASDSSGVTKHMGCAIGHVSSQKNGLSGNRCTICINLDQVVASSQIDEPSRAIEKLKSLVASRAFYILRDE
ncbi:MAG: hypothetical protein DHS20C11_19780 [Lysobacteraceae bacterium]|nr:MAG: hypothetical protein DHS20C11_19780 [Xanthomonadaceae bacterium]